MFDIFISSVVLMSMLALVGMIYIALSVLMDIQRERYVEQRLYRETLKRAANAHQRS
ncbi:MAG: hypothetical protein AAFO77_11090 [Pseudomonadota bacterium]